jgi:EAL and modified HD-GYP domain-containing signal transduction protein
VDVFVARQPVFDRQKQVYGYELLFRSGLTNRYDGTDSCTSTAHVLSATLMEIGIERLIGSKKAFVNFGRDMLLSGVPSLLPVNQLVIEVLETVAPEPEVLAACEDLRRQGFLLALDDFVRHSAQEEFLPLAHLVKVEVNALQPAEHREFVAECRAKGLRMLAEKVETEADFQQSLDSGYDFFQGYFFAKPVIVKGRKIPALKLNCLRMLSEVMQPELDYKRLAELISQDVGLTYRLLRYVNSCLFSAGGQIDSVSQALLFPGETNLRKWIMVAAMPGAAMDKPAELQTVSLVRASFCESLARITGAAPPADAFLMGLLSFLDALLGQPMHEALRQLNVNPNVAATLTGSARKQAGLREIHQLVAHYDAAEWDRVSQCAQHLGVDSETISREYLRAVEWAEQSLSQIRPDHGQAPRMMNVSGTRRDHHQEHSSTGSHTPRL